MIRIAIVIISLISFSACSSGGGSDSPPPPPMPPVPSNTISVAPDDAALQYSGRWNFDNMTAPWVGWQGSSVRIAFTGTAISAEIDSSDETEQWRVSVDGVAQDAVVSTASGRDTVTLASGLDGDAEHTVVLMKETYYGNRTTFYGFTVTGNSIGTLPAKTPRRIAFFGDSNMDGTSMYSEKDSGDSGTYFGYPAMASRMLDAEMNLQAVGGAQLDSPGPNDVISFIYSEEYDHEDTQYRSGFEPQVIVVNAGANDIFSVGQANQKDIIKQRYKDVISAIRNVYGTAPHIILYNAYGWDLAEPANYSFEVANEVGGNLSVLLYPWAWEQWHGSMVEHAGQARVLAEYIDSLGPTFSIVQDAEVFDGFGRNGDVANGSFEEAAFGGFDAFGWRYHDDGVERVFDGATAADGNYYVRLDANEIVHQGMDATGDFFPGSTIGAQQYTVTAKIRSVGASGEAVISADYEEQALYNRENLQENQFTVTDQWQDYQADFTAPDGTWKIYVGLRAAVGVIEFDNVRMSVD